MSLRLRTFGELRHHLIRCADFWVRLLVAFLFILYAPFLALDLIGFVLAARPWGLFLLVFLFKLPRREISKAARPTAVDAYQTYRVLHLLYHLFGSKRDRR